ncbi:MAG: amidohydrolase family protein [Bacteroidota bacterium]
MLKIDSHQHFWNYTSDMDSWINDEMAVLRNDFMPEDLRPLLMQSGFDGCVAVQADQSPEENNFLLKHAEDNDFIMGVVGWVDLRAEDLSEQLSELSRHKKLKGFRHILQGEEDRALMLQPDFLRGIGELKKHGFTYDVLIYPDQLQYLLGMLKANPGQPFVLDHIAKPDIKNNSIGDWKVRLEDLKGFDNLYCKVSGMVTEADWKNWKQEDFIPYLDVIFETFGADRVMFGSDWPVCLVAASYAEVNTILETYISNLSLNEQELFWGGNAVKFYNLN